VSRVYKIADGYDSMVIPLISNAVIDVSFVQPSPIFPHDFVSTCRFRLAAIRMISDSRIALRRVPILPIAGTCPLLDLDEDHSNIVIQ
jgi:hypothetical protein